MHLLTTGDSWTFGSEIRDPALPDTVSDWDPENNEYRIPKIWPTMLKDMIKADDLTNISYPAASNDRIVRTTMSWITENYIKPGLKPEGELFVVVGLTSPERKDFYYKDPVDERHGSGWTTIWPNQTNHPYMQRGMQPFFDNYRMYLWNKEEFINRYVQQVLQLENFFKVHNIDYMFFQAFYNVDDTQISQWEDKNYVNSETEKMTVGNADPRWNFHYNGQNDGWLWEQVDSKRFYGKDTAPHSFHSYITAQDVTEYNTKVITGMHPNQYGHMLWARELNRFIRENKVCEI